MKLVWTVLALALTSSLAACKSGPRVESCDDDPAYFSLVNVSGDLGSLNRACQLHYDRFALALRLSIPSGTTLALGNDPWTADEAGIHWLDLRPWLLDLPLSVASGRAESIDGPIGVPLGITTEEGTRRGEVRLDVGTILWSNLLGSVADGFRFPRAGTEASVGTLVYVGSSGLDGPVYLGQAQRLRDLTYVAVGRNEEAGQGACGPYNPEGGGGVPFSVANTQYRTDVTVFDAHTGEVAAERQFVAGSRECPDYASSGDRLEARVPASEIVAWLEGVRVATRVP